MIDMYTERIRRKRVYFSCVQMWWTTEDPSALPGWIIDAMRVAECDGKSAREQDERGPLTRLLDCIVYNSPVFRILW
jgi:hypothetical protein